MTRNRLKKCLIIGSLILIANFVCIPTFPAILSQNPSQNNQSGLYGETSVSSAGGKPDLIVSFMDIKWWHGNGQDYAVAEIKNIGDADASGTIYVEYEFTRRLFRTVARIGTVSGSCPGSGLPPEGTMTFFMIRESELPKFGFFVFRCMVNPDFTIDESNFDNNDLSRKYVAFLGQWKAID